MSFSTFTKYDPINGELLGIYTFPEKDLALQDGNFIKGSYCSSKYYYENGIVEKPKNPYKYADFDYGTKLWVEDEVKIQEEAIETAKQYLSRTDWYYARFNEIGDPIPEEVVNKRIEARNFLRENE